MHANSLHDLLRDEIVSGRMHPNERLVEADLAARFDVSRAVVRTALMRLVDEGLVEHERNRGAKVRLVGEAEAIEIYEVRGVLEGLIARAAATRIDDAQAELLRGLLADIRAALEKDDTLLASEHNMRLHALIIEIADHETASSLLERLNSQVVRFQYRAILQPGRAQESLVEHTEIVEAIVDRDPDRAEQAMRAHMRNLVGTVSEQTRSSVSHFG